MKYYTRTTQPAAEPLAVGDLVPFLRSPGGTEDNTVITSLITVAREAVEDFTGRSLMASGWRVVAPDFGCLKLERSPLVSVSSVKYYADGENTLTTLSTADYLVITGTTPGRVQLVGDAPALADRPDAVQVEFIAGAANASDVPATLVHALRLLVAHHYELRTPINVGNIVNEIPMGLRHILESQRIGGWIG